jgi:hypothetical protein
MFMMTLRRSKERAGMQRVRIGLTGLACVFLLVVLAAAVFGISRHGDESATSVANSAQANRAGDPGEQAPRDPLAELGVAPGNAPQDEPPQGSNATAERGVTP